MFKLGAKVTIVTDKYKISRKVSSMQKEQLDLSKLEKDGVVMAVYGSLIKIHAWCDDEDVVVLVNIINGDELKLTEN